MIKKLLSEVKESINFPLYYSGIFSGFLLAKYNQVSLGYLIVGIIISLFIIYFKEIEEKLRSFENKGEGE